MDPSTNVVFSGNWSLTRQVEPGSVPDRTTWGAEAYRPGQLRATFHLWVTDPDPAALQLGNLSWAKRVAGNDIKVSGIEISGKRLKANGEPGLKTVSETFYSHVKDAPDWARQIVLDTLTALGGQA
jgi:hypothetical protein